MAAGGFSMERSNSSIRIRRVKDYWRYIRSRARRANIGLCVDCGNARGRGAKIIQVKLGGAVSIWQPI